MTSPTGTGKLWLAVTILVLAVMSFAVLFVMVPVDASPEVHPASLLAGERTRAELRLVPLNRLGFPVPFTAQKFRVRVVEGRILGTLSANEDSTIWYVTTGAQPGTIRLRLTSDVLLFPVEIVLRIDPPLADADGDGYPDVAELVSSQDRKRFRDWFVNVAESQYYEISPSWRNEDRDCAGLLRFAYREALKKHDGAWLARFGFLLEPDLPDIGRFHYPEVPLLGTRIFRLTDAAFRPADVDTTRRVFGNFARAASLKDGSLFFCPGIPARPGRVTSFST